MTIKTSVTVKYKGIEFDCIGTLLYGDENNRDEFEFTSVYYQGVEMGDVFELIVDIYYELEILILEKLL